MTSAPRTSNIVLGQFIRISLEGVISNGLLIGFNHFARKVSRYWVVRLLVFILFFPWFAMASPPYAKRLGVEASGDAFVDIVKQNYRWELSDGHGGWTQLKRENVDEHGWPKGDCHWVMDLRPCAEWAGQIDDPDAYRVDHSGTYKGSFTGGARLIVGSGSFLLANQKYDERTNQTTFELSIPKPGPNHGFFVLEFRDTRRTPSSPKNTGIGEFKLLRPGYNRDTEQIFTNEYMACLKSAAFSTIRFMAVTDTNGNVEWGKDHTRLQSWNNRKLPADATIGTIEPLDKKDGWPWEYAIDLCNQTNMDMWLNIPVSVDDVYIRQLAQLLESRLKPALNIYIEHSNEVWNFGFIQYAWNKGRAKEEVKEGKVRYNYDNANNEEIWGQRRHAQRVKDAVDIFAGVFGKEQVNKRIRGVLAGVTPDPKGFFVCGRLPGMLEYLTATNGDPKNYIYAISIPAYYGGKAAAGDNGTEHFSVDMILDDMKQSIEASRKDRLAVVKLAQHYELPGGYCAYESGPDIGGGRTTNIGNRIKAIRDRRQATLYRQNFGSAFWDLGGTLAMQFTLSGSYSRFGAYGLTDDISEPDRNSLFSVVRELVGDAK